MKRTWFVLFLTLMMFLFFPVLGDEEISSVQQLNEPDMKVGTSQGSATESIVQAELPLAEIVYCTDNQSAFLAVAQGKIDAFVYDYKQLQLAIQEGVKGIHLLDETLGETVEIAVGISPASDIPDLETRLNTFISELKENGVLDDMYSRWVISGDRVMPDIDVPENPELHLNVGTTGTVLPYSYYEGTELTGYDIELARRFAAWINADLQFKVYDYGAIVPAAISGDVDCIMADLNITPERAEVLPFSQVLFEEKVGIVVKGDPADSSSSSAIADSASQSEAKGWQAYNGKRLGVLVGPLMEDAAHEYFPDSEYLLFNTYPDCIAALLAGKIDAYLGDEPSMKSLHREQPEIDYIPDRITENNYSFAFRKNDPQSAALCDELNVFLARCWADGTMQELYDIWFGTDEDRKVVDMSGLTGENGTIRVVTTSTDMPFSYIKDGRNVGYDIDLIVRFCLDRGYKLELGDVDFAGRIPAVQSGKYDFTTDMNVTPEREEQVLFSEPTSKGGIVLAVLSSDLKSDSASVDSESGKSEISHLEDLNGKRIGIQSGSIFDQMVSSALPDAKLSYYNTQSDLLTALASQKIDAFPADEPVIRYIASERDDVTWLPEFLDTFEFAYCFSKTTGETLCDEFNEFLTGLKEAGKLEELKDKWFSTDESIKTLPDIDALPATNGTLVMATDGDYVPFEYIQNGRIVGYDVDIAAQFCEAYGYGLQVQVMNLDAVLPAVQSGKADFGGSALTITPERAESVLFSEPNYTGGTVMAVLKTSALPSSGLIPEDFNGRRAGVITGSFHDSVIQKVLPNSKISHYSSYPDMISALKTDKIDYFLASVELANSFMASDDSLMALAEPVWHLDIGAMFVKSEKGSLLCSQMDDFITELKADGTLEEIYRFWNDPANNSTPVDLSGLTGENGTLQFATSGTKVPVSFIAEGQIAGTDPDIAVRFCRKYGYDIEIHTVDTAGILPGISSGKYDFSLSDMVITDERKESVAFSIPYHESEMLLITRKEALSSAAEEEPAKPETFFSNLLASFERTFIRESRWKLFVEGVLNTLFITAMSILFGTALGFLLFMICRNGNPAATNITGICLWLVQGTPTVVLLMILYYIIFGSIAISGIAVAIIGFTLTFGGSVFGMLKMGVGAVDPGQYEAAYALGHTNRQTFFRIILPQAIPHVLPAYQGEITGLIKATAIVGYIAVQDLTKMGDIVRSRTYEAFFPLIAVTVIYFILEGIFNLLVKILRIHADPKKRSPASILKGVNTHDQD